MDHRPSFAVEPNKKIVFAVQWKETTCIPSQRLFSVNASKSSLCYVVLILIPKISRPVN